MDLTTNAPRRGTRATSSRVNASERREVDRRLREYHRTGDTQLRSDLVERLLPLARSLALRFSHSGESVDDLMQVAALGLVKAIDRFDPDRGFAFTSFATPTILGELRRHLRDTAWALRVPRELQERALVVSRAAGELTGTLGRPPTASELSAHTGLSVEDVVEARAAGTARHAVSIYRPLSDGEDEPLADMLGADDPAFAAMDDALTSERLLASLPPREREILRLRYQEELTQWQIGERVGCSQMHVSRLIRQSLRRLRETAEAA
ncbi:MAG: polymerase sigma-B factor [Gaiellaceae bacterium]|jgi:RNA polymerase sigma-B factor|nr:polymerase sigma-B factor [Gaiellaceae bacterium]MEA2279872.1 polymerase sigma-B factor [Solirubrobacteraceae bacterium]